MIASSHYNIVILHILIILSSKLSSLAGPNILVYTLINNSC